MPLWRLSPPSCRMTWERVSFANCENNKEKRISRWQGQRRRQVYFANCENNVEERISRWQGRRRRQVYFANREDNGWKGDNYIAWTCISKKKTHDILIKPTIS